MISQISMTCVNKAWNLKYDTTEMTTATNEGCIGLQTFDSERFKSIKENFSD